MAPEDYATAYAQRLLSALGLAPERELAAPREHPAITWARSGLMALTGRPDGAPLMCPAPLAACADGALAALASLAPPDAFGDLRGSELLAERAAIFGYSRQGSISPGGSCRLLQAADGWIALNLARESDWELLPAWLERDCGRDWETLAAIVRRKIMHDWVERGRELGLAIAPVVPPLSRSVPWFVTAGTPPADPLPQGESSPPPAGGVRGGVRRAPIVVDLSSLWAGPLCTHLLQLCGARVVKVESTTRPDGARNGPPAFFDLLNQDKECVALDFSSEQGRAQLGRLIERADIVIEASRPRALRQLGIDAEALVRERDDLTWIGITGYGRSEPQARWIAYGDDAGVAAGLPWLMHQAARERAMVGDGIADPLTGLHAALAAWASWRAGGSGLISLALRDVVAHCIGFDRPASAEEAGARAKEWSLILERAGTGAAGPRARRPAGSARALGADNAAWA